MEVTSRERMLKNIRHAIISKTDPPFENVDTKSDIFVAHKTPYPDVIFAEAFSETGGKFIYCENEHELITNINALYSNYQLKHTFCCDNEIKELLTINKIPFSDDKESLINSDVSISYCECLIARFGSVLMSSRQATGRKGFIAAPIHIVLAYTDQIVMDIKDAFAIMRQRYREKGASLMTFVTGASRTADIEKTLVMGAHGPKEVFVFLTEKEKHG